jgi:hypothetical protein
VIPIYYSTQRHNAEGRNLVTVSFSSLSEILVYTVFLEDGVVEALPNKQLRLSRVQKSCKIEIRLSRG